MIRSAARLNFIICGDDRPYHLALPDTEGIYYSLSVAGFWLRVDWLWQDPLPDELDVLREVGIDKEAIDRLIYCWAAKIERQCVFYKINDQKETNTRESGLATI